MIYKLANLQVDIRGDHVFVADNATVIGDVTIENNVSIWFGAVLRGDTDSLYIGEGTNVQDCAVLHADPGSPLTLGKRVTLGHHAMVHGCTVGDGSLIGINAVVLNGAKIGKGCIVGANALVPEGMQIPDGSLVLGSPAKIKRQIDEAGQQQLLLTAQSYIDKIARYKRDLTLDESFTG